MKIFAGAFFLTLMLCHALGLSLAVLALQGQFNEAESVKKESNVLVIRSFMPSVPYAGSWESSGQFEGLYRIDDQLYNVVRQVHENDTLYVTLQMNESAWQRFSELSDLMREVNTGKKTSTPLSTAIKLLNDVLKIYPPLDISGFECNALSDTGASKIGYPELRCNLTAQVLRLNSPPPEKA